MSLITPWNGFLNNSIFADDDSKTNKAYWIPESEKEEEEEELSQLQDIKLLRDRFIPSTRK